MSTNIKEVIKERIDKDIFLSQWTAVQGANLELRHHIIRTIYEALSSHNKELIERIEKSNKIIGKSYIISLIKGE